MLQLNIFNSNFKAQRLGEVSVLFIFLLPCRCCTLRNIIIRLVFEVKYHRNFFFLFFWWVRGGVDTSRWIYADHITKNQFTTANCILCIACSNQLLDPFNFCLPFYSRCFIAPLGKIKLEYTVRGEQRNLLELIKSIADLEGLRGFWKGKFVNVLRTAPFKAINFLRL